jgi:putative PIN family toxin of toxin-antitoxin system
MRAALQRQQFVLVTSEQLLAELAAVLARPRFTSRYGVTRRDAHELVALIREQAEIVPVLGTVDLCRDPDDDVVIETAQNGHADVLVTRDDDLKADVELVAALTTRGVSVLTVRRFLAILATEGTDPEGA